MRAALSDDYPRDLCVVRSPRTPAQLATAAATLEGDLKGWFGVDRTGDVTEGVGLDGDVHLWVPIAQMTDRFAAWLQTQPKGLVQVDAWLAPTH